MNHQMAIVLGIIATIAIGGMLYAFTEGFVGGIFDTTKIQKTDFTVSDLGDTYRYHTNLLNSGAKSISIDKVYLLYGKGMFEQTITASNVGGNESFTLGSEAVFLDSGADENCYKISDVTEKCSAGTATSVGKPNVGDYVTIILQYTADGNSNEVFFKTRVL